MAEYSKLSVVYVNSPYSDYTSPTIDTIDVAAYENTTATNAMRFNATAKTTGTTIVLTNWTSISGIIVKNLDTTNYVTVTWTDPGTNANSQRLTAGKILVIPSAAVSASLVLTANTANCEVVVIIEGIQ